MTARCFPSGVGSSLDSKKNAPGHMYAPLSFLQVAEEAPKGGPRTWKSNEDFADVIRAVFLGLNRRLVFVAVSQ